MKSCRTSSSGSPGVALSLGTCLQSRHAPVHAPKPACKPDSQAWLPNNTGSEGPVSWATGPLIHQLSWVRAICVPSTGIVPWARTLRVDESQGDWSAQGGQTPRMWYNPKTAVIYSQNTLSNNYFLSLKQPLSTITCQGKTPEESGLRAKRNIHSWWLFFSAQAKRSPMNQSCTTKDETPPRATF